MIPDSKNVYDIYSLILLVCYTWIPSCTRQETFRLLIFPMLRFEFGLATMPGQDDTRDMG